MSFFVMPYTFTVPMKSGLLLHPPARRRVGLHLFETALNGPLFWAFDKKRHTHAP